MVVPDLGATKRLVRGDTAAVIVNRILAEHTAVPRLVRHDGTDWHLHAVPDNVPLAEQIAVETAMAMVDMIRADELSRLGVCAEPNCDGLVIDLSRNRSRRFCSTACGNRVAVAAYRARKAATTVTHREHSLPPLLAAPPPCRRAGGPLRGGRGGRPVPPRGRLRLGRNKYPDRFRRRRRTGRLDETSRCSGRRRRQRRAVHPRRHRHSPVSAMTSSPGRPASSRPPIVRTYAWW
jgi:CGNR zinc finger